MKALITNDDGIESPGLVALAQLVADEGLEPVVAAPSWDSSGAAASLTAVEDDGRIVVTEHLWDGFDFPVFGVDASPAFIVRMGATGAFGDPPDLVVSGINRGPNTGHAVLHSGTVGAALTASTHGISGLAVSMEAAASYHWETAVHVARPALRWVAEAERAVVLNVNVPNVPVDELAGFVRADLASFGAVVTTVTERGKGFVALSYDDVDAELEEGTDAAALAARMACYTPLLAVCEARAVDTEALDRMAERLPA